MLFFRRRYSCIGCQTASSATGVHAHLYARLRELQQYISVSCQRVCSCISCARHRAVCVWVPLVSATDEAAHKQTATRTCSWRRSHQKVAAAAPQFPPPSLSQPGVRPGVSSPLWAQVKRPGNSTWSVLSPASVTFSMPAVAVHAGLRGLLTSEFLLCCIRLT